MKREREKHITRLHIILFFLVIIIGLVLFIVINNLINSDEKYVKYESVIKNASKIYYKIYRLNIGEDEEEYINITKLDGILTDDTVLKKCKGYVLISNELDYQTDKYKINYKPAISCGNKYSSTNYSEATYIEITEGE